MTRLTAAFQKHQDALIRFLTRRLGGDREGAADVAHDAFLRLLKADQDQVAVADERAYVFRVAGNLAIDMTRRDRRRPVAPLDDLAAETLADPAPSPERVVVARDRLRRLEAALATLPPKPRLALLMFRVDGLSHAEIARRLGVSESMVAKYLAQALRCCRDRLWGLEEE